MSCETFESRNLQKCHCKRMTGEIAPIPRIRYLHLVFSISVSEESAESGERRCKESNYAGSSAQRSTDRLSESEWIFDAVADKAARSGTLFDRRGSQWKREDYSRIAAESEPQSLQRSDCVTQVLPVVAIHCQRQPEWLELYIACSLCLHCRHCIAGNKPNSMMA